MIIAADSIHPELHKHLSSIDSVISIRDSNHLYEGIRNHPDLQIAKIGDTVFVTEEVFSCHKESFKSTNTIIVKNPGSSYPDTASLNCLATETHLICHKEIISKEIFQHTTKFGLQIIHCKQGYIRCTTIALSSTRFITDDPGIHKTLSSHSFDVLLIGRGDIHLDHHPYGFFGGCCGLIHNTLYINGDLNNHSNHQKIRNFCQTHGITIVDIPNKQLTDTGCILSI